jgi:hypothetical protein
MHGTHVVFVENIGIKNHDNDDDADDDDGDGDDGDEAYSSKIQMKFDNSKLIQVQALREGKKRGKTN